MIQQTLSHYPLGSLQGFGLILFLAIFAGALFWVFSKRNASLYSRLEKLPLQDNEKPAQGGR